MAATRVTVVSDTHLSTRAPEARANWSTVLRHVAEARPDLVVHLGDLSLDGAHEPDDLRVARELLDELEAPWRATPGNHDIGDNPWGEAAHEFDVDETRLQRWREAIDLDWWSVDIGAWTLVALDAQLLGSGLRAESAQWAWLEHTFDACPATRPIALVTHKPLAASADELVAAPPYRFVPERPRGRLTDLMGARRVELVLSGHVHQYRALTIDGRQHVWAPTTWAVLPDAVQPRVGHKTCGIVSLVLRDDGDFDVGLSEPAGITQLTIGQDFASPYPH